VGVVGKIIQLRLREEPEIARVPAPNLGSEPRALLGMVTEAWCGARFPVLRLLRVFRVKGRRPG
jgi:hypothetical protein